MSTNGHTATRQGSMAETDDCVNAKSIQFEITCPSDLLATSEFAMNVDGTLIENSCVPFGFRFVLCSLELPDGKQMLHAGLAMRGKFHVECDVFEYLVAERWPDHVAITPFTDKASVRRHFREIQWVEARGDGYCTETAEFKSTQLADSLVAFFADDISRTVLIDGFEEEDLASDDLTNCVSFAIRGGMMLSDIDSTLFQRACAAVIYPVRSRSESTDRS